MRRTSFVVQMDGVREPHVAAEPTPVVHQLQRTSLEPLEAEALLVERLREMRVHRHPERARELGALAHQQRSVTLNGEHGASAIRSIEPGDGSWNRSTASCERASAWSVVSTTESGGEPAVGRPEQSMEPRHGWNRIPSSRRGLDLDLEQVAAAGRMDVVVVRGRRAPGQRELREPDARRRRLPLGVDVRPHGIELGQPAEQSLLAGPGTRKRLIQVVVGVHERRDPREAADLGSLDQAAIDQVREEAWPQVQNADELHEALFQLGFVTEQEGQRGTGNISQPTRDLNSGNKETKIEAALEPASEESWEPWFRELRAQHRANRLQSSPEGPILWVATERLSELSVLFPSAVQEATESQVTENAPAPQPTFGDALSLSKGEGVSQEKIRVNSLAPSGGEGAQRAGEAMETPSSEPSPEQALAEVLRGRLEGLGPATAPRLASSAGLAASAVEAALIRLEAEGFVLRGKFTPGTQETEWCARHLLARIHRRTLNRLRREIEPVSSADFMRFLLAWQQVSPDQRGEGPGSLTAVLEKLEGFEAQAAAWEGEILPARLVDYDPAWLDSECVSGAWVWSRLTPPKPNSEQSRSLAGPIRSSPITLVSRKNFSSWDKLASGVAVNDSQFSLPARTVLQHLRKQGASFFADLVEGCGLLRTQVEDGLGELAAWGLITTDSFTGLRALLTPSSKRPPISIGRRKQSVAAFGMEKAGRWSLLRRESPFEGGQGSRRDPEGDVPLGFHGVPLDQHFARRQSGTSSLNEGRAAETIARVLLRRYGVVFRRVLDREGLACPWREFVESLSAAGSSWRDTWREIRRGIFRRTVRTSRSGRSPSFHPPKSREG